MKKVRNIIGFILAFYFLLNLHSAYSQPTTYLKHDYIKVKTTDVSSYLNLVQQSWKPVYQNLIESGDIDEWYLYRVMYPGGEEKDYNFVFITVVDNLTKLDVTDPEFELTGQQLSQIMKLGKKVKSEIWKIENQVNLEKRGEPAPYKAMDYMKVSPGKGTEYLMLEEDIARPIHRERIDQGVMVDWHVYSLIIPGGTEYGYNYATGNFYNDLSDIEYGFTTEVIANAHPKINIPELWDMIYRTRDMVSHELWKLVDYTR